MASQNRDRGIGIFAAAATGAFVVSLIMGGSAFAQLAGAPAAAPQQALQWTKFCSADPSNKKNVCQVRYEMYAETGQFIASAMFQTIQDDPKLTMVVGVPNGMQIQPGLKVVLDDSKTPTDFKYSVCMPNTCFAEADVTADYLKSVKSGKQLTIFAINYAGQQLNFPPITLAGFTKAYDGPGLDPNSPSGQAALDALQASLKKSADEARQRLISQQQARPQ